MHHIDGDKTNNEAGNLVLIEYEDHMRLHDNGANLSAVITARRYAKRPARPPPEIRPVPLHRALPPRAPEGVVVGQAAQAWHREGLSWGQVAKQLGITKGDKAQELAEHYEASLLA